MARGDQRYLVRNKLWDSIPDFTIAKDLLLTNTWFKKKDSRLITFKSR